MARRCWQERGECARFFFLLLGLDLCNKHFSRLKVRGVAMVLCFREKGADFSQSIRRQASCFVFCVSSSC